MSGGEVGMSATKAPSRLERVISSIEEAVQRVHDHSATQERLADTLNGSRPEADMKDQEAPVQAGVLFELEAKVEKLHAALNRMDNASTRLRETEVA